MKDLSRRCKAPLVDGGLGGDGSYEDRVVDVDVPSSLFSSSVLSSASSAVSRHVCTPRPPAQPLERLVWNALDGASKAVAVVEVRHSLQVSFFFTI
jgi:hypothetical protein